MCNSISLVLWTVFLVGQVVPVVLHRIWCEQAVPAGGTGGTGIAKGSCCSRGSAIFHGGPTGPTHWSHQKSAERPAVPPVPPVPPA
jgi:hypothetical protein